MVARLNDVSLKSLGPRTILATATTLWIVLGAGAVVLALAISLGARAHPRYLAAAIAMASGADAPSIVLAITRG